MAFGALEGAFPQPVVDPPASSISLHPGLLSFGSPQAEVPLSGAGGVLLLQTIKKGNVSLKTICEMAHHETQWGCRWEEQARRFSVGETEVGSAFTEGVLHFHFWPSNSTARKLYHKFVKIDEITCTTVHHCWQPFGSNLNI